MSYEAMRFREEAALCRRLAEEVQSPMHRNHYLGWAKEYDRLATEFERRGRAG